MEVKELSGTPGIVGGYLKAFGSALPLAGRLPGLPGGGGEKVPDLELRVTGLVTDRAHLAAYAELCGFALRDTLPAPYLNVRAFGVHIALMTDGGFPFGPVGLVHLRNVIEHRRPVGAEETLDLRVWATGLRPHAKGRTVTLHTEAAAGDEVVWAARSTMLRTGPSDAQREARGVDPAIEPSAEWRVGEDTGRLYAAVSGDRNPIHLHALTARAFGFRRAIAHGLWTKARSLAALQATLPDAFTVDVSFRKPLELPATVAFGATDEGTTTHFAVQDALTRKAHLVGTIERTSA